MPAVSIAHLIQNVNWGAALLTEGGSKVRFRIIALAWRRAVA